ncbi:right-handed parallel beta-helix repeat-containing protein [Candidatus Dojkabacteria bacterium]|nr:right-handed parallel beta-helix repeat-containing protein [Candidatus Dojkabacteria bacterium]
MQITKKRINNKILLLLAPIVIFAIAALVLSNKVNLPEINADWTFIHENFEYDFLEDGSLNPNKWSTENKVYMDIVQDTEHADDFSAAGEGYVYTDVTAATSNYSMIKQNHVQGGILPKVSTEFWFRYEGTDTTSQFSIAAFRNLDFTALGQVRIINTSANSYNLTLRYNLQNSTQNLPLTKGIWYKVTFVYDSNLTNELTLTVDGVGTINYDSMQSSVEYFNYGKTSSESVNGSLYMDNISIIVPENSDFWVNGESGNDSYDGLSPTTAFKTIQRAVDMGGPGSVIHIMPTTEPYGIGEINYETTDPVKLNYSGLNPQNEFITIRGEGADSGDVVIDGTSIYYSSHYGGVFEIQDTKYYTIENLTIQNSDGAGVFITDSSNINLQNLYIENTQISGIYVGDASNISIHDIEIYQGCQLLPAPLPEDNIAAQENISIRSVSDFQVYNTYIHGGNSVNNGGEGICVKGYSNNGLIYGNTVTDLPGDVGIYVGVGSADPEQTTHDILVYGNNVSTDVGIAVTSEYGGTVEDVDIFNNVVHDGANGGIMVVKWRNDGQPGVVGMRRNINIFNNTVYNMGQAGDGGGIKMQCGETCVGATPEDPDYIENITIKNNIMINNQTGQLTVHPTVLAQTPPVVTLSNNLMYGGTAAYEVLPNSPYCTNCIGGDPLLVNISGLDFDLQSGSPAIDKGTPVLIDINFDGSSTALSFDYLNRTRPQDGLNSGNAIIDIGAFEYQPVIKNNFTINITKSGKGNGKILSNPSGINCGTSCNYLFPENQEIALRAIGYSGSIFTGWSGNGCSGMMDCYVTMDSAKSVTANFEPAPNLNRELHEEDDTTDPDTTIKSNQKTATDVENNNNEGDPETIVHPKQSQDLEDSTNTSYNETINTKSDNNSNLKEFFQNNWIYIVLTLLATTVATVLIGGLRKRKK